RIEQLARGNLDAVVVGGEALGDQVGVLELVACSPLAASNPIEKVRRSFWPASASSATITLESTPPDRSTPTGTSATWRRSTARRRLARTASAHSGPDLVSSSGERSNTGAQ